MKLHLEKAVFLAVMAGIAFLGTRSLTGPVPAPPLAQVAASVAEAPGASVAPPARRDFFRSTGAPPPDFAAIIGLLADLESGEVYFEEGGSKRWPIASITKLLTAVEAGARFAPERAVTLDVGDFLSAGGDIPYGLTPGESYAVSDLVRAMLIFSSNEAAEALARTEGREAFLAGMNARAAAWGMHDTHFSDPTGLSAGNQSTARDLLVAARRVYEEYPELFRISRTTRGILRELQGRQARSFENINVLAGRADFVGGKTGYTDEAGGNLLSVFRVEGRPIVVLVLGSTDRFGDTEMLYNWFRQSFVYSNQ